MHRDDYIIRIYRRDRRDRRMVVGTVEKVSGKLKMSFADFEELRLIMGVPRGRIPRRAQSGNHTSSEANS
jgi:hypothetical protein